MPTRNLIWWLSTPFSRCALGVIHDLSYTAKFFATSSQRDFASILLPFLFNFYIYIIWWIWDLLYLLLKRFRSWIFVRTLILFLIFLTNKAFQIWPEFWNKAKNISKISQIKRLLTLEDKQICRALVLSPSYLMTGKAGSFISRTATRKKGKLGGRFCRKTSRITHNFLFNNRKFCLLLTNFWKY